MGALKDLYSISFYNKFSRILESTIPSFDRKKFLANISGDDFLEKPLALYAPKTAGWEAKIADRLARWRELKAQIKKGS